MTKWKWVPVEPTEEQVDALKQQDILWVDNEATGAYKAMVMAAPSPMPIDIPDYNISEAVYEAGIDSLRSTPRELSGIKRISAMMKAMKEAQDAGL